MTYITYKPLKANRRLPLYVGNHTLNHYLQNDLHCLQNAFFALFPGNCKEMFDTQHSSMFIMSHQRRKC